MGNWTVQEVRESQWAQKRLQEPYGVCMGLGDFGLTIEVLTLAQVLDCAEGQELQPGPKDANLPQHVAFWMKVLDIASIYALEQATCRLMPEQRLEILSRWFNGGGELPRQHLRDQSAHFRLDLGHRTIFNNFLRWAIEYLAQHKDVDGRVGRDQEALINEARRLKDQPPVTRWP